MTIRTVLAIALGLALPALAVAQDAATRPAASPPVATSALANSADAIVVGSGGMKMADTAATKIAFVAARPAGVMSSKLIGLAVYNNAGEAVGEIQDLVVANGETIQAVVLGVGGFLGVGERYVAVSPASLTLSMKDDKLRGLVDATRDALKAAPTFEYKKTR